MKDNHSHALILIIFFSFPKRMIKAIQRFTGLLKSFEQIDDCSSEWLSKSFERLDVFNKRVSKSSNGWMCFYQKDASPSNGWMFLANG